MFFLGCTVVVKHYTVMRYFLINHVGRFKFADNKHIVHILSQLLMACVYPPLILIDCWLESKPESKIKTQDTNIVTNIMACTNVVCELMLIKGLLNINI